MKKALKFLSIILSLAMVLSMFAMLPISAAEPTNLIQFPNFVLNEKGDVKRSVLYKPLNSKSGLSYLHIVSKT